MSIMLTLVLTALIYIILMFWVHDEISSGERKWERDKEEYLTYLKWLKKGYYGVKLEN